MQKTTLFILFILAMAGSGCASFKQNQWLAAHRTNLARYADSNVGAELKMDGLIQDYVQFMKEDLQFVDPVKGIKFVKKYHDQNLASMDKILVSTEAWQNKLSLTEKLGFGLRVVQKPYLKDLIDLAPKFKRKYKEYEVAVKLGSKVSGSLTKFAGKSIGL
jgi:hypothetical protein